MTLAKGNPDSSKRSMQSHVNASNTAAMLMNLAADYQPGSVLHWPVTLQNQRTGTETEKALRIVADWAPRGGFTITYYCVCRFHTSCEWCVGLIAPRFNPVSV